MLKSMREPHEGSFLTDLMELGPAPTMGRELVVIVLTVAVVATMFALVGPSPLMWIACGATAVYMSVRFAAGLRGWNRSEAQR